jgi:guanylate kinase
VLSVSATTRAPREGEKNGREYTFLTRGEFVRWVDEGLFLEWAEYGGNFYGTPSEPVRRLLAAGNDVLLEIELQGARQVRRRDPEVVMVFIAPPTVEALESRLRDRGTETEDTIQTRLCIARDELANVARDARRERPEFDYVIVNDNVEQASCEFRAVIEHIRKRDPQR